MSEWFTRWFGREYLDLYPHRNEAERNPGGAQAPLTSGQGLPWSLLIEEGPERG